MIRLLLLVLVLPACSLYLSEAPTPSRAPQADAGTPTGDGGPPANDAGQVQIDGGNQQTACSDDQRRDPLMDQCVPKTGTAVAACHSPAQLAAKHGWVQQASVVRYAASGAIGSGETAEEPGDLAALVAASGTDNTAIVLAAGTYALNDTLMLGIRGPISLVGACASETILSNASATVLAAQSGSVSLYGLGIRGPISDNPQSLLPALAMQGLTNLSVMQSTIDAQGGHGIGSQNVGAEGSVVLSGLTFGAVRNSAIAASDAVGSWTVEGNLMRGPIGEHGVLASQGSAQFTLRANTFETITKNAMHATGVLGSWTVEGNLMRGPVSGDGISIAGSGAQSTITVSTNTFESIVGNGLSAQESLGTWTVEGNFMRGPIGGAAMHFHQQGGSVAMTNNEFANSANGVIVNGGSGAWTVTGNTMQGTPDSGPVIGFGFANLSSEASVAFNNNTLAAIGGVALGFHNSLSETLIDNNTISDTWSNQGGGWRPLASVGLGVVFHASSRLRMTNSTLRNNAYGGVLIDLRDWDAQANGAATITLTDNPMTGHGEGDDARDVVLQDVPQDNAQATVVVTNSGSQTTNADDERVVVTRREPPPPRCGNGIQDPGEDCDAGEALQLDCSPTCQRLENFRHLAAGPRHFCTATVTGELWCHGRNDNNQLTQHEGRLFREGPTRASQQGPAQFYQLSLGERHSCGLTLDRLAPVFCWGDATSGQLGISNRPDSDAPYPLQTEFSQADLETDPVAELVSANTHNCVRHKNSGKVRCWGSNDDDALGLGAQSRVDILIPTQVTDTNSNALVAKRIWTGFNNTCALQRDDSLVCWGARGVAGVNPVVRPNPANVVQLANDAGPLVGVRELAIGASHACAIYGSGQVACWGDGSNGELGHGDNESNIAAQAVKEGQNSLLSEPMTAIATTAGHLDDGNLTCALGESGRLFCWGHNAHGIGRGPQGSYLPTQLAYATPVMVGARLRSLAMAQGQICALNDDGNMLCWGDDTYKSASFMGTHQPPVAVTVAEGVGPVSFERVIVGSNFALALEAPPEPPRPGFQGRLLIWGQDPREPQAAPLNQVTDTGLDQFIAPDNFAVAEDGFCVGTTCYGIIGQREYGPEGEVVTQGLPRSDRFQIKCGANHCCGYEFDSTSLHCWGDNSSWQLGHANQLVQGPLMHDNGSLIDNLALGDSHTCYTTRSNSDVYTYCFGDNSTNQLGNPDRNNLQNHIGMAIMYAPGHAFQGSAGLFAGHRHSCVVGQTIYTGLYCWGNNHRGQTGRVRDEQSPLPHLVEGTQPGELNAPEAENPFAADANDETTCWLTRSGEVVCMGSNAQGLMEPGSPGSQNYARHAPAPVLTNNGDTLSNASSLSVGRTTACFTTRPDQGGQLFCWGNRSGGMTAQRILPITYP